MRTPDFWYNKNKTVLAACLTPFSVLYRMASLVRTSGTTPWQSLIPVLCIGNAVAGGAGKTPVAISLGRRLIERGIGVHYLTRGYGGSLKGPVKVNTETHACEHTGDEALLLARTAPTWVSRNRKDGILAATVDGAGAIVMDDGFQNPSVHKTVSVCVINGAFGFGNGRLIPAGPLREPAEAALGRADAVVLIGEDQTGVLKTIDTARPVLRARIEPGPEADQLKGERVLAFAGIGLPQKFFDFLTQIGCDVIETRSFADHHAYSPQDISDLRERAEAQQARLVTTAKDAVRLPADSRAGIAVLSIKITWQDEFAVDDLLDKLFPDEPNRDEPKR
jgi:tetraacyldisaccharide 4'-kinase